VDVNNDSCPKCGLSFWDFEKVPEINLEHSVEEENIKENVTQEDNIVEEEFECPLCNGIVTESDTKCKSCGVEFMGGDEPPDKNLEKSIMDLENFIENTVSEFEIEGLKEEEFLSTIKDLEEFEEGRQTDVDLEDDVQKVTSSSEHDFDSSHMKSEIHRASECKVIVKPSKIASQNTCPVCEIPVMEGGKYCTKCGMISLAESEADKGQIKEFLFAIKNLLKVQETLKNSGEIQKKLQILESDLRDRLGDENLWFQRGLLLFETGSLEKAIKSMDTVIKLNPQHKKVWIAKGNILGSDNRLDEAAKCYQRALELTILEYPEAPKEKSQPAPIERPAKRPIRKPVKRPSLSDKNRPESTVSKVPFPKKMSLTRGLTKGLKRKKPGMVNGLTNGKINGINRRKPGMVNGLTNGKINGLKRRKTGMVNGLSGRKPGLVNGLTNGKVNGLNQARLGMINGLTNGLTNGITNGLTNGLTRGKRNYKRNRWAACSA
jgi:tetratricopeptide (TPR) repeat protein